MLPPRRAQFADRVYCCPFWVVVLVCLALGTIFAFAFLAYQPDAVAFFSRALLLPEQGTSAHYLLRNVSKWCNIGVAQLLPLLQQAHPCSNCSLVRNTFSAASAGDDGPCYLSCFHGESLAPVEAVRLEDGTSSSFVRYKEDYLAFLLAFSRDPWRAETAAATVFTPTLVPTYSSQGNASSLVALITLTRENTRANRRAGNLPVKIVSCADDVLGITPEMLAYLGMALVAPTDEELCTRAVLLAQTTTTTTSPEFLQFCSKVAVTMSRVALYNMIFDLLLQFNHDFVQCNYPYGNSGCFI